MPCGEYTLIWNEVPLSYSSIGTASSLNALVHRLSPWRSWNQERSIDRIKNGDPAATMCMEENAGERSEIRVSPPS